MVLECATFISTKEIFYTNLFIFSHCFSRKLFNVPKNNERKMNILGFLHKKYVKIL